MPPQQIMGPNWLKPALDLERDEFHRTAQSFGLSTSSMLKAAQGGQLVDFPYSVWGKLENSDSFDVAGVNVADSRAKGYGRDTSSLKNAYMTGEGVPAPIVWRRQDGSYYLIAGNTRLMLAKAFGLRPKVFLFRY